jgi:hypothetical protein
MGIKIMFVNIYQEGLHSYHTKLFHCICEAEEFYDENKDENECDNTESIINLNTGIFVIDNDKDIVKYYCPFDYHEYSIFNDIRNDFDEN